MLLEVLQAEHSKIITANTWNRTTRLRHVHADWTIHNWAPLPRDKSINCSWYDDISQTKYHKKERQTVSDLRLGWLVEQGLTSHQTHYRSYRGRIFTGQMTQPTVSEHWRKLVPKHQTSIPSGPPHRAHNNTTTMQCETKTHKVQTRNKSTHSDIGPVWQNLVHRTVRTAHICVQQHSTEQFWLSSLYAMHSARDTVLKGYGKY